MVSKNTKIFLFNSKINWKNKLDQQLNLDELDSVFDFDVLEEFDSAPWVQDEYHYRYYHKQFEHVD